jgi:hypothetical protein
MKTSTLLFKSALSLAMLSSFNLCVFAKGGGGGGGGGHSSGGGGGA